ncbi:Hypothetical predicted protein, partial [Paramuricea clavata]
MELVKDPQTYFNYLTSDKVNDLNSRIVSDEMDELHHEYNESFVEPNAKSNVVIAAFTTAYASHKLYKVLDQLQEQVLYYNTDSVIFVSKPGEPEPLLGPYLSQLTNKLKEGYITTFISDRPKNYCYKISTGKVETKNPNSDDLSENISKEDVVDMYVVELLVADWDDSQTKKKTIKRKKPNASTVDNE